MDKQEFAALLAAELHKHVDGLTHGYSQRKIQVEDPDRLITHYEWQLEQTAFVAAIAEMFVTLGLIEQ